MSNITNTPAKPRDPRGRSAVTNGNRFFIQPMPNTKEARRLQDLYTDLIEERGGPEAMHTAQREAARMYATFTVLLDKLAPAVATGDAEAIRSCAKLTNSRDRQARRMGPAKSKSPYPDRRLASRWTAGGS